MWALLLCTSTSTSVIGSLYGGYKSGRLALCQAPLWLCAGAGVAVPRRLGLALGWLKEESHGRKD